MYRIFFIAITIVIMLLTLCAGLMKPAMHKSVLIYDSEYKIAEPKAEKALTQNMPAKESIQKVQKTLKTTKVPVVEAAKTKTPVQVRRGQQTHTPPIVMKQKKEEKKDTEIILWNQWRSALQNQIMTDVRLPILPQGTVFKFSFDVDKYGKISHVQTWSTNAMFTPYAIQYIAPVIKSYQGHEILNFPQGSNRISTTVDGGWKIAQTSKYSSADDFKDTEINKR